MNGDAPALAIVAAVVGVALLRFQLWRAVVVLRPTAVRLEPETPAEHTTVPLELSDSWLALEHLGFRGLGAHSERAPLRPAVQCFDAVHATEPVNATVRQGPDGDDGVVFFTKSERGFVVTANHKRPAREVSGAYLAGGLEGVSLERLFKAHLRRLPEIGASIRLETLDALVAAEREWLARFGKTEWRQRHAVGLLWTLFAVGMVSAAVFRLLAGPS